MPFKDRFNNFKTEYLIPFYIAIRNGLKKLGKFLLKIINGILGHIQSYKLGYLVFICFLFIIATIISVYYISKIASKTIVVAESIKKIEELNNLSYQQSRQIILHIILDMKVQDKLQPAEFEDVPIFKGNIFNKYSPKNKYNLFIKNDSPFHFEGDLHLNIGLSHYDQQQEDWLTRIVPYEVTRDLKLEPHDCITFELTNDLLNSGALATNSKEDDLVKINVTYYFEDVFQPKIKLTQRLSFY